MINWYPNPVGNHQTDEAFRIAFDNLYSLRDQMNRSQGSNAEQGGMSLTLGFTSGFSVGGSNYSQATFKDGSLVALSGKGSGNNNNSNNAGVHSVIGGTGITANNSNGNVTVSITSSGVTAGTYGDANNVGQFTVNAQGQITAANNVAIAGGGGGVIGLAYFSAAGGTISGLAVKGVVSGVTRASAGIYNLTFSPNQSGYTASILANSDLTTPFTTYINTTDTTPPATGFQFATVGVGVTPTATDPVLVMVTVFKI